MRWGGLSLSQPSSSGTARSSKRRHPFEAVERLGDGGASLVSFFETHGAPPPDDEDVLLEHRAQAVTALATKQTPSSSLQADVMGDGDGGGGDGVVACEAKAIGLPEDGKWRWLGPWVVDSENFGSDRIVGEHLTPPQFTNERAQGAAAQLTAAGSSSDAGWLYGGLDWPKNDCGYSFAGGKTRLVRCRRWIRPRERSNRRAGSTSNKAATTSAACLVDEDAASGDSAHTLSAHTLADTFFAKRANFSSNLLGATSHQRTLDPEEEDLKAGDAVVSAAAEAAKGYQSVSGVLGAGTVLSPSSLTSSVSPLSSPTLSPSSSSSLSLASNDKEAPAAIFQAGAGHQNGDGDENADDMSPDEEADWEYEALLEVYHACGGSGWVLNKGWALALRELSAWVGVTLKKQPQMKAPTAGADAPPQAFALLVESLSLSRNNLAHSVPPILGEFRGLALLDLSHNDLQGPIPDALGQLESIQVIDFSGNRLTGPVPNSLGSLSNTLHTLRLGCNVLSGPIPKWLDSRFGNLKVLRLDSNLFTGPIPSSLQGLVALEELALSRNPGLRIAEPTKTAMADAVGDPNGARNTREGIARGRGGVQLPQWLASLPNLRDLDLLREQQLD